MQKECYTQETFCLAKRVLYAGDIFCLAVHKRHSAKQCLLNARDILVTSYRGSAVSKRHIFCLRLAKRVLYAGDILPMFCKESAMLHAGDILPKSAIPLRHSACFAKRLLCVTQGDILPKNAIPRRNSAYVLYRDCYTQGTFCLRVLYP